MIDGQRIAFLLALVAMFAPADLRGDETGDAPWHCPKAEDGACIPNPRSFGFYPTRWRKWPSAKPNAEDIGTPKPAKAETEGPKTPTEELPTMETQSKSGMDVESPDLMPSDPNRPGTRPELPPELKSDLPQPPDLESLLPESGPDEAPSPPPSTRPPQEPKTAPRDEPKAAPKAEPKVIPSDEDPFKDDPLPGDDMGGASRQPAAPASNSTGQMHWRPDPKLKPTAPIAKSEIIPPIAKSEIIPPVAKSEIAPPVAKSEVILPVAKSEIAPPVAKSEVIPPVAKGEIAPPVAKSEVLPPIAKSQIVLADAQGAREPKPRPIAVSATSPAKVALSPSNPLRSATSGMILPCPIAEDDEVVPAAAWSPEGAAAQAETAAATSPVAPGSGSVWRANPLRAGR